VTEFYFFLAIIPSVILHEVSHGWVANYFGDPTAKNNGRLTLNPLAHIDPFGTVLLPALMIFSGWVLTYIAVKYANSALLLDIGVYLGLANLVLAVFNLIPIPPLDGSAIIERFVPRQHLPAYYRMRARALPVVMVLVVLDFLVFHVGTNALYDLETWWINLIPR